MSRPSFSSTLLASFLLIVAILGAAAISGWLGLESFARDSRNSATASLALSSGMQRLAERTVDLERGARQYLVYEESSFLERFHGARAETLSALAEIENRLPGIAPLAAQWRQQAEAAEAAVAGHAAAADASQRNEAAAAALAALARINDSLAQEVRGHIMTRNHELLDALDQRRERLTGHILAALALAITLAGLTGWWLLRPLRRIEQSIADIGESRLGQPIGIDGPADLRRVGKQLDWLRLRLGELEANRNRVLRHVSHELKTPLASLREGVSLLADGVLGRLTPEQQEVAAILEHNTRALQERIEQLLHYNAIQFDARRLDLHPSALLPMVREVAGELQLQAQARDVTVDIAGDAPLVRADTGKLRIALSNLIANAIGFSPAGSCVRIELSTQDEKVVIDCIDDGPGIRPEESERIFEPFFQGSHPDQRAAKGTGLGLAIVREFIAAHHGKVSALPTERGAHFRVELPHAT
ncbi:sensor histidine kinase [Thauera linaloolentis]|uniref:histidine kinase n=1 Tax=Thauera linaloolentis (strain DSM 12138 / JCM 21573 / CCUG 41526 / CIP 105981 / IAM 15112 / NBRC 102519 / 47Lol) TaxID=1123367 RepID=N6Z6B3_THAL4|nr:ATP-binding protein [Thauera linaloolentis]ENO87739.1 sensory transduction histidine kinase [Thauera linaloolentis 47Lol = DSM 12138]MCM8567605.1 ATP-binding protein [Thauera linaloolentis]